MKKKNIPRRFLCTLLVILLLCPLGSIGASGEEIPKTAVTTEIYLNGKEVLAEKCFRIDGTTYVPFRDFSQLFGNASISWNGLTNTATCKTKTLTLTATVGSLYILANGHYLYTVAPVRNFDGRVYVPIRPMAKSFAAELVWNERICAVELKTTGKTAISQASYNADEVYWLSRIISAEAKGEPFKGQIAVGDVVLNRVRSSAYPNSIYGVIFDRKYGVQFSPILNGSIYQTPTSSAVIAAKICLEGTALSDSILFFLNPRIATSSWIVRARSYEFSIGNHDFYR